MIGSLVECLVSILEDYLDSRRKSIFDTQSWVNVNFCRFSPVTRALSSRTQKDISSKNQCVPNPSDWTGKLNFGEEMNNSS